MKKFFFNYFFKQEIISHLRSIENFILTSTCDSEAKNTDLI